MSLALVHGASDREVMARLDRVLEPYGGLGAMPRSLQLSHFFLQSEIDALRGMGQIVPVIFLAVAGLSLAIALLTVSWQAVRAALANPVDSLRYE